MDKWVKEAVALAERNVARGGGPFAALIIRDDDLLATGTNQVTATLDPTAHAEVVAIRAACQAVDDFRLTGCTLISSCEPCPLCLSAALWARVDEVLYAADRNDAAEAGFDDRAFHTLFTRPRETWPLSVRRHPTTDDKAPFQAWLHKENRIEY
ncbi:nucleoside deaminase [Saccharothrix violaceirubra]